MRRILTLILLLLLTRTVHADDAVQRYYSNPGDSDRHGWWWYDSEKEPEEKKDKEKPEPKKKEEAKEEKKPLRNLKLSDYPYEKLWSMHPDDFNELIIAFHKQAVQTLSQEDEEAYAYLKSLAIKKSLAQANMEAYVNQQNPQYSMEQEFPYSVPARQAQTATRLRDVEGKLAQSRDNYALLFFYSPTCPYCAEEDKMLEVFTKKYGWTVKKLNRDSQPALATQFNVQVVPTLIMIKKGEQNYFPISYGVLATAELESKIYRSVRLLNGEITPEQWSTLETEQGGGLDPLTRPTAVR